MKKVLTSLAMVALTLGLTAQEERMVELRIDTAKPKAGSESRTMVIKTKGDKPEKMVIEVDGENVTINGKPVDNFEGGQVNIRKYNSDVRVFELPAVRKALERIRPEDIESVDILRNGMVPKPPVPRKARLGVSTVPSNDKGAKITEVSKGSAAEKAGLQTNDIITSIDKKAINNQGDLLKVISEYDAKAQVKVEYLRDGKSKSTKAVLDSASKATAYNFSGFGTFPDGNFRMEGNFPNFPDFPNARSPRIRGFYSGSVTMNAKPRLGIEIEDLPVGDGVKVIEVDDESAAFTAGLAENDIIQSINGNKVADVDAMKEQLRGAKPGDKLVIAYTRKGEQKTTTITFPKPIKKANL